jgi:hypothetical protein
MRFFKALDVREREGKEPVFSEVGTLYVNDDGKMSLYLPITGRFYPVKEQQPRQQQPAPAPAPATPPTHGGYGAPEDPESDLPF